MNSCNKLIHILVLIVDLYLFRSPRRSYRAYTCIEVPVGTTEIILVQRYHRYYRAYAYTEVSVGTTELILVQRYL